MGGKREPTKAQLAALVKARKVLDKKREELKKKPKKRKKKKTVHKPYYKKPTR